MAIRFPGTAGWYCRGSRWDGQVKEKPLQHARVHPRKWQYRLTDEVVTLYGKTWRVYEWAEVTESQWPARLPGSERS